MCDNDSYDRRKVIWVSAVIFKRDVEDERYRKKRFKHAILNCATIFSFYYRHKRF